MQLPPKTTRHERRLFWHISFAMTSVRKSTYVHSEPSSVFKSCSTDCTSFTTEASMGSEDRLGAAGEDILHEIADLVKSLLFKTTQLKNSFHGIITIYTNRLRARGVSEHVSSMDFPGRQSSGSALHGLALAPFSIFRSSLRTPL